MEKTLYKVNTSGGQIIDHQKPEKVILSITQRMLSDLKRHGFFWDESANYYPTRESAVHAINWAMCN